MKNIISFSYYFNLFPLLDKSYLRKAFGEKLGMIAPSDLDVQNLIIEYLIIALTEDLSLEFSLENIMEIWVKNFPIIDQRFSNAKSSSPSIQNIARNFILNNFQNLNGFIKFLEFEIQLMEINKTPYLED